MAYRWEPAGTFSRGDLERSGLAPEFDTQQAAEEWLTSCFPDLLEAGIDEVTLFEEDRLVYGPMSLLP